jgi:hypothetical protein
MKGELMARTSFTGRMARRLLVNWRVPIDAARNALPVGGERLRPRAIGGFAVVGLCLVRLDHLRPAGLPAWVGLASENLAIRMGVEWDTTDGPRGGVLVMHRETSSLANQVVAKRMGFGVHHPGRIVVREDRHFSEINAWGKRGEHSHAHVVTARSIPNASVFKCMEHAESFFRGGETGYSPSMTPGVWNGLHLHLHWWSLQPMHVVAAGSAHIDRLFGGTAEVDSAFIMRDIPHTWTPCGSKRLGYLPHRITLPRRGESSIADALEPAGVL